MEITEIEADKRDGDKRNDSVAKCGIASGF